MSTQEQQDVRTLENREWLRSLRWMLDNKPEERIRELLSLLQEEARQQDIPITRPLNTPYLNTLAATEADYPGDLAIEEKLTAYIRWNAMAMVVRANKELDGIGGHISTYNSIANLFEVGFHHFFRMPEDGHPDIVYFQGHASPGIYARAFLEGRLSESDLENFRRELRPDGGLPSYPHPRCMPGFWTYPTVSMGLGPLFAIYQARFNQYLYKRGLIEGEQPRVWGFFGDGEMDEPEATGNLSVAAREKLDHLTFVIDCNLQRLDGPVRGNRKVIQELEALYRGTGWNVIKVLWSSDWDPILEKDKAGKLAQRLAEVPDGQFQKYANTGGEFMREDLFGDDPDLEELVADYSDEELGALRRGGHDPVKIYQAFRAAVEHKGQPTVILAHTVKGYGQGDAGEASNVTHQKKKFDEEELRQYRDFFDLPVSDDDLPDIPFLRPEEGSPEAEYLKERREELGGFLPRREDRSDPLEEPDEAVFRDYFEGSDGDEVATTMVLVQILSKLLKDDRVGKYIVPIVPDESRTFGMESLFRQVGIYAPDGQHYDPVDEDSLLYYREAENGAILEEGITEAGCMGSFTAAGTAHLPFGLNTIPFFLFYSMFGFQRIGDLAWAAADAGARGFLIGGTSGRTTLSGEGLQHADGQSHLYAYAFPNLMAYDPAFAYEVATIVQEGIRRMYVEKEARMYYLTVTNATYPMPPMPDDSREGILRGLYRFRSSEKGKEAPRAQLLGSGAVMTEVLRAADYLEENFEVAADVWSITSYKALYDDAIDTERRNRRQDDREENYLERCLADAEGAFVAACDYVKALPLSVAPWFPGHLVALGTDGFGRSDSVAALRDHFEVDYRHIACATLHELVRQKALEKEVLEKAIDDLDIDPEKVNPRTAI